MAGLRQSPDAVGLRATQEINVAATITVVHAAALRDRYVSIAVVVAALVARGPATGWLVAGALAFLVSVRMTVEFHVPRDDALATLDPDPPASFAARRDSARTWTLGGHVRTVACLVSSALLAVPARVS